MKVRGSPQLHRDEAHVQRPIILSAKPDNSFCASAGQLKRLKSLNSRVLRPDRFSILEAAVERSACRRRSLRARAGMHLAHHVGLEEASRVP